MPPPPAPMVITLAFDHPSFERLDGLRRQYFPPERNFLPAHLTLFHALPGKHEHAVRQTLEAARCRTAGLQLLFSEPRFLGQGVALDVHSERLLDLRAALAREFSPWLTAHGCGVTHGWGHGCGCGVRSVIQTATRLRIGARRD